MGYDGMGGRTKFIEPVSFPAVYVAVPMLWHLCSVPSLWSQQKMDLGSSRNDLISL